MKPMYFFVPILLLVTCLNLNFSWAQTGNSLETKVNDYLNATTTEQQEIKLNEIIAILHSACFNAQMSELSSSCVVNKILAINNSEKVKNLLEKSLFAAPSGIIACSSDTECAGVNSCLDRNEDDYFASLVKVSENQTLIFTLIAQGNDELSENQQLGIAKKTENLSCQYNFECQSFFCQKAQGANLGQCKKQKICRLGRADEIVKPSGNCEEGLQKTANICIAPTTANLLPLYNQIKDSLAKTTCGEFKDPIISESISKLALDLRAFELMISYAQDFQVDYQGVPGVNHMHYHQIPKRLKELFLDNYLSKSQLEIKKINEEFSYFTKQFDNLLKANGLSHATVNFYDISGIQKEMHSQKATAEFYLVLYQNWVKIQQQYYSKIADLTKASMVDEGYGATGFLSALDLLAATEYNKKEAPFFSNNSGKRNQKRWLNAFRLPNDDAKAGQFNSSPYVEKEELDAIGFTKDISNYAKLLDPILPPKGCKTLIDSENTCMYLPGQQQNGSYIGSFRKNIPKTLEELYNSWFKVVVEHYKNLAKDLPANTIIDPELNIYAGCIQDGLNTVPVNGGIGIANFYKNFCTPDLNKNGAVDATEKVTEITLKKLAKKMLTYSLSYSFENFQHFGMFNSPSGWFNSRSRFSFIGADRYYKDEFYKNEEDKKVQKPTWIDPDIEAFSSSTVKFYDFAYGSKKKFLNKIRNKYFFKSQLSYLLAKNFDKQLKCLALSGDYGDSNISGNNLTPTPTPNYNSSGGSTGSGSTPNSTPTASINNGNVSANSESSTGGSRSSLAALSSGQQSNSNLSNTASDTQNKVGTPNTNDESKKSFALGGVEQKGSGTTANSANDKKAGANDYGFFGNDSSNEPAGGITLTNQEQGKVNAALNSNQEPQFSQDDTVFTQITKRYVKSYKRIFRTERRSSAQ